MKTISRKLNLGDFLKNHRLGEELTQTEMANILGISKQRLSDIENNRKNVSIKLCKKMASTLDLPPEWLVKLALQNQIDNEGLKLKVS
jgi:DNA-binding XRE family transcriptional regulator